MSMDTIMEDSDYSVSNTDAVIYCASDISGWTESLVSDPNIPNSSSTSEDEYQQQQNISTAAAVGGGDDDDLMIIVSSDESSGSTNNNKQIEQKIRLFNVERCHECSICGLEFPTGQALGGHMRWHRAIITNEDEYQQQISTDNMMIIVSSGESSRSTNNIKQIEQKIRIFNVDLMGSVMQSHECSICGLEFPTGQALGGHMRRHRAIITSEDEYQQQILTDGGDDSTNDLMIIVSSGESSRSTNNKQQIEQNVGTIFNVDSSPSSSARPRHECSICGLEFSSGQALGGHMRRHRPIIMTENLQVLSQLVNQSNGPRVLCLDLNLTPLENDLEFKLGKADPIVNLFF